MESSPKPIRLQDLQDHTESLQALALRLVGDEASAQDLVQDTLVTAVERPQRRVRALGAWLKTVLRHRAYRLRSSDRSRRLRERTASRVEADSAAPDALVERIELQHQMVAAVLELDEPLRSTLVLKFFGNHDAEAIAEKLDIEVSTVRWRLRKNPTRLSA